MAESLMNQDNKKFWKEVSKSKVNVSNISAEMDGVNGVKNISEIFGHKYSQLYSSVGFDHTEMTDCTSRIDNLIKTVCMEGKCEHHHSISVYDVINGLSEVKSGKCDGSNE